MSVRAEIVDGMAEILWATAWADHAEEHGCANLSGQEITNIMPRVPREADAVAERWARKIEASNGTSLDQLYKEAMQADAKEGKKARGRESSPESFGNDLAFQAMGSGVSWFDDHAAFSLKVPDLGSGSDTVDLKILAEDGCDEKESNPPCKECGSFNREGKKSCANCGEKLS
jgi:hypothetical protein